MLALPGRSLSCSYGLVPRLSLRTRNYSSLEKSGDETIAHYSYVAVSAFLRNLLAKLLVSGMHGRLLQAYFGRPYSSRTFQSSSPVPHSSQIIQSHVPVPCSSGESSPAIRHTQDHQGMYTHLKYNNLVYIRLLTNYSFL